MEYKDSGIEWIGEIPGHWEVRNAGTIFAESKERGSGLDEILSATQAEGMVPKSQLESVVQNAEDSDLSSFKKVRIGDFVISLRSFQGGLELASKYEGRVTPAYTVLRPRGKVFSGYFKYLYKSNEFIEALDASTSGIREGKTIRYKDFKQLQIPIPIYKEQQSIANYLDEKTHEIDSLIEGIEKSIELLEEYRKAVVSEAVTKGLDSNVPLKDSGIEWIGEIPEHWEIQKLRFLGTCQNGISKAAEFFGSGFPFVTYGNVYRDQLSFSDIESKIESTERERELYSVKRGDVLFTRTSETIDEIGIASTCLEDIPDSCFAGFVIRFRPNDSVLLPEFSRYFFRSDIHRSYLSKEVLLVTRASLGQTLLKDMPVLIPPLLEQQAIAEYLDDKAAGIDSLIENQRSQIDLLREYRKSLISEAVTGKFKVPGVA